MTLSVNTNAGALIALQNLTATQAQLAKTQNEVSTGLAVSSAKDNGAIFAIAQNQRSTSISLDAVKQSLQRVQSTVDVATNAGTTISDLLNQMKVKALAAADTSLDTNARTALNSDFTSLRDQITKVVSNASFNGANLIDGSISKLQALANADGSSQLTVAAQTLALSAIGLSSTDVISGSAATASAELTKVSAAITQVNNSLAKLGSSSNALQTHLTFISNLQDTIDQGIGNLVDANLAKESAQLQALQTKQSLGIQALSIANSSTSSLLSLFR